MVLEKQNTLTLRRLRSLALLALTLLCLQGCREEVKNVVGAAGDPEHTPTMLTRDVETLISDSGIVRYRIVTPLWEVFDNASKPYWRFPNTLNLAKFDDLFRQEATIRADSAFYRVNSKVWELDGNVRISNIAGERFLTDQLFWDQRAEKVYSDRFIRIEQPDRTLEGYGFISNDRLTSYSIRRVSGIFPAESLRSRASESASSVPPPPLPSETQP